MSDTMPREWCRGPQYAGEQARKNWAPVIRSAQEAWSAIELVSVSTGLRPSALTFLEANELVTASRDASGVGLMAVPLSHDGQRYRVAITAPPLVRLWHTAWAESNDELIGQLLGFPPCCREKFADVWVRRHVRDQAPYCGAFAGPWENNILLRHIGVRLVAHLPCSGDCEDTLRLARAHIEAGRAAGADVESIERLLRLPLTYDALNGVAIVDAGDFRFQHGTDNDPGIHFVERRAGNEGEGGVGPPPWADNGFSTRAAMDASHDSIMWTASTVKGVRTWLDLGAGDGTLLARLGAEGRCVAVEADPRVAERGNVRHPAVEFWTGRIADYLATSHDGPFDAVLLMPGRVLEMPEAERPAALAAIRGLARRVLVYAYGDNTGKGGLGALCTQVGITGLGPVAVSADGSSQAAWVTGATGTGVTGGVMGGIE